MASPHDQPTRVQPTAPQPAPAPAAGGTLDLKTLIITAAASALAAFICSKVWAPGTLASAAFTPVAVAIFREALRKPTEVVTTALPAALPITRRGGGPADPYGATRAPLADADRTQVLRVLPGPDDGDAPTLVTPGIGPAPAGTVGAEPVSVHAVAGRRTRRRWQIAIGTGLLGFVIAALLITVPEVIAGKDSTTIFRGGGSSGAPAMTETTPATTTTVVQQVTTVPPETVTETETVPTTTTTETQTVTQEVPPATDRSETTTTRTTPTTPTTGDVPEEPVP